MGSVPKYVATTPDGRYVIVTNWCTFDLSIIDVATPHEVKRIPLGRYPRHRRVTGRATAYVALMGASDVMEVDLARPNGATLRSAGESRATSSSARRPVPVRHATTPRARWTRSTAAADRSSHRRHRRPARALAIAGDGRAGTSSTTSRPP